MDYLDSRGSSEYRRKQQLCGMTGLLLSIAEMGSRAGSIGLEGASLASSSISPKSGRHRALCPQALW